MMFLARPMAMWLFPVIVTMSIKRQQGVERVIHALLKAEIAAKQARSINYQLGVAKLPLAKELAELSLQGTPINGELIAQLATGAFLDDKRNVVLVGGTGLQCSEHLHCLSPSSLPDSLARTRSRDAGSGQSLNGAPFLSAPGLRASTGT